MNDSWKHPAGIAQTQLVARSLKHWTGRDLLPGNFSPGEFAEKVFHAPFVLVAHGTEADPVLNYGNQTALMLWEMSWAELTRTPSRLTAEAPNREERARLLAAVTASGFIDDYSGIRISKSGRRFVSDRRPSGICSTGRTTIPARPRCFRSGSFCRKPDRGTAKDKMWKRAPHPGPNHAARRDEGRGNTWTSHPVIEGRVELFSAKMFGCQFIQTYNFQNQFLRRGLCRRPAERRPCFAPSVFRNPTICHSRPQTRELAGTGSRHR